MNSRHLEQLMIGVEVGDGVLDLINREKANLTGSQFV